MPHVELLDATLRDGQQSLWGMRMQAGMALPVADTLDRTGFKVIDAAASSFMEVLVKYCREDPWEGLDLLRAAIPRATVAVLGRSFVLGGGGGAGLRRSGRARPGVRC